MMKNELFKSEKLVEPIGGLVLFSLFFPFGYQLQVFSVSVSVRLFHILGLGLAFFIAPQLPRIKFRNFYLVLTLPILIGVSWLKGDTALSYFVKVLLNVLCCTILYVWFSEYVKNKCAQNALRIFVKMVGGVCLCSVVLYVVAVLLGETWSHFSDVIILDRHQYRLLFPFGDPNFYGLYLISVNWLLFSLFTFRRGNWWLFFSIITATVLTLSNSLFLAFFSSIIIVTTTRHLQKLVKGLFISALIALVLSFLSPVLAKVFEVFVTKFTYGSGRIELWIQACKLIIEKPFFGYGWAKTPEIFFDAIGLRQESHNTMLDFTISLGILGATFYLIIWFVLAKEAYTRFKEGETTFPAIVVSFFIMQATISTYFSSCLTGLFLISSLTFKRDPVTDRPVETD